MVTLVRHDLEFILNQIKISEQHAQGTPLTDLVDSPLLPFGLRTVDGSLNNLVPGREQWGASGEPFTRITEPNYVNEGDDQISFGNGAVTEDNNDYAASGAPGAYGLGGGTVVDADPRIISNLIVDQTLDNPAAIAAALRYSGYEGQDLMDAVTAITAANGAVKLAEEANPGGALYDMFKAQLDGLLEQYGIEMSGNAIVLPNQAPDDGISASYNSWFTLFGQFFDHGLDLVSKGGNGTVYIPLQPDDPLYVPGSHSNFMVMTRASTGDDAANVTTPWVDQNQTYTSHASHQVFLREYAEGPGGHPISTGRLLEGERGLATWGDVKAQARDVLGIELTDADAGMVPVLLTDAYGEFIRGENGLPQILAAFDENGQPIYVEGNLADPVNPSAIQLPVGTVLFGGAVIADGDTVSAARTGNAFLDDIAHVAVPVVSGGVLQADDDSEVGYSGAFDYQGRPTSYDDELLDAHYITGDGRGNENIGLSAVHHIFHAEHNRIADQVKDIVLDSGDLDFLNEWLLVDAATWPSAAEIENLVWDGERVFQAARFTTEMEYQHLVFEEFARKVQPDVDVFMVQPNVELDPAILAEFANVVYRFGHSMLNETVDRIEADGTRTDLTLFDAFLNPLAFGSDTVDHHDAAGAIIRGMTSQVGNEIDEFVTDVLRNQLLGIPLDLAAINIARGRDTAMPTLNQAREQFQEMAGGDTQLDPYASWIDFALNLKNPESIVNFVAAYGTHDTITSATTLEEKRSAAMDLVFGGSGAPADRNDFLNATGAYAEHKGGLDLVDLWVGGLAEKKMSFGGMLGSTFSFVFEMQMENLQSADRFYYLSRTQGLNLLTELENNSLAKMALRNTDLGETGYALPGDIFSTPDHAFYLDYAKQLALTGKEDPTHENATLEALSGLVQRTDGDNDGVAEYFRYNGADHIVVQGTDGDDHIVAGDGDDTIWGGAGNDRLEAGYGVDKVMGGDGDDIITNSGTDIGEVDMLKGDGGNDVIHGGSGMALIFGGSGKDFLITGPDGSEIRAGRDDDFLLGGEGSDILFGNEGDDWVEGAEQFEYIAGDNGELFFNSTIIGHDVLNGGSGDTDYDADSGDDIMFGGEGIQKNIGMWGHDWVIHQNVSVGADADMNVEVFTTLPLEVLRDRFSQVEALSGWMHDDILRGDDRASEEENTGALADPTPEGNFVHNELDEAGIARIAGLDQLVTDDLLQEVEYWADGSGEVKNAFIGGNILLGGGGSDLIQGRGGDDIIDGDAWLAVRISIRENADGTGEEIATVESMKGAVTLNGVTRPLSSWMLEGALNPGQLVIVREIRYDDSGTDTAVYWDELDNYEIQVDDATGRLTISHVDADEAATDPVTGKKLVEDGTDKVSNIEQLLFGEEVVSVVTGTAGNDAGAARLDGAEGSDLIIGLAGDDVLRGLDGDDMLFGGSGDDRLVGGNGDDRLEGGDGNDELLGNQGDDILLGGAGEDTLTAGGGDDLLDGGEGDDVLLGNAGDDTLEWHAGGGRDRMSGGAGTDTVRIVGNASAETYRIYNAATAAAAGLVVAGTAEIIITRQAEAGEEIVAEIDSVEEIIIEGMGGGDTFEVHGSFDDTSLSMSTITIEGSEDDDTVDISNLTSAHRVVFRTQGGQDLIIGEMRDQDVVELAGGKTPADYTPTDNEDGSTTISGDGHSVTFKSTGDAGPGNDDDDDDDDIVVTNPDDDDDDDTAEPVQTLQVGDGGDNVLVGSASGDTLIGRGGHDVIVGEGGDDIVRGDEGNDFLDGGAGRDIIYGGEGNDDILGGAGGDALYGEAGADRILGGDGNDLIDAGTGDDTVFGGAGDDTIVARAGDGNDVYYGDDMDGGTGSDTLDMSMVNADVVADLGTGLGGRGSVYSSESGSDTLWGIENIVTGLGDDVITASDAVNFIDGGQGADTFRFLSASAADGDTIVSFQPGDKIDLAGIDAVSGTAGNQSFTLVSDAFSGAAGELMVSYETRDGEEFTVIEGNTAGGTDASFKLSVKGTHNLTESDFNL